ncbi:MAG: T9SS C-terminal target domain-containing protein [Bacteroidetes bacterium]|nr:MAG: T9SS C-terminal target domain-containing protein [Bacteroidota bacterium]
MKNTYFTIIGLLLALLGAFGMPGASAQTEGPAPALLEAMPAPPLSPTQERYFNALTENQLRFVEGGFVKTNAAVLQSGQSITLQLPGEKPVILSPEKRTWRNNGRLIWKARDEAARLTAIFVVHNDLVTGSVTIGQNMYRIYPLGEGLHYIQSLGDVETEGCGMEVAPTKPDPHKAPREANENPDIPDDPAVENFAGGECKIRVLVAYTNAVDAAAADILSTIELYIEQYNDANANSLVGHEIELARAVEVNYAESFSGATHPDHSNWTSVPVDLLRFQNPSDGFMDNVHSLRNLYDADMCVLMTTNLAGWGGYAYDYAPPASKSFCAVVWNNGIPQTFAHELGHLLGMHHDTFVDGSSGYYHGYIDLSGPTTFRTIMSYSNACGATPCPVIDYWSNPYVYYFGNVTGSTSTHNNARVSREHDHIIAKYQNTVVNKKVFLNDQIRVRESATVFAGNTITTDGRTVTYHSGSTGQYVAKKSVEFKPGFWARSGTEFRAFLDYCSNVNLNEDETTTRAEGNPGDFEPVDNQLVTTPSAPYSGLEMSPNPAEGPVLIRYRLAQDARVKIELTSPQGQLIRTLFAPDFQPAGPHESRLDVSDLAPGMYYVVFTFDHEKMTRKLVVAR